MTKSFPPVVFELSDDERNLLLEALGDHAMRYHGHPGHVAERCELLAERLEFVPQDDAPITERKPTTISSIPPLFV